MTARGTRLGAVTLLAALVTTACGTAGDDRALPHGFEIQPGALAAWDSFPVNRQPRPLVLLRADRGPYFVDGTFSSDNDRVAMLTGQVELDASLPPAMPPAAAGRPITASEAWAAVTRLSATPVPVATVSPVRVSRVALGTLAVHTDRGKQQIPAWHFTSGGATVAWPAVTQPEIYQPGTVRATGYTAWDARLSADQKTVTVRLPAAPAGCPAYQPDVRESATAVVIGLQRPACRTSTSRRLTPQDYQITLAKPLGARVLAGPAGVPLPVQLARN
ncbi:hypothetical protein [Longispora albida]|uniref:hypothetical protein n=1 Tax=Longispora albida TaxID=203523 RepID=UPI00037FDEFF|nr:hypothetical protein [Longispora albida]